MAEPSSTVCDPPVVDFGGFVLEHADLAFLHIESADLQRCVDKEVPLGMSAADFDAFRSSLAEALDLDRVHDADVRLKGSSAHVFSSPYKSFPCSRAEITDLFRENWRRVPEPQELDQIFERLEGQWPKNRRPNQRPFDSMHRLRIDKHPSDYDLQISSDDLFERARGVAKRLALTESEFRTQHASYGFLAKDLLPTICAATYYWSIRRSEVLGREVTLAVFPGEGPTDVSASVGLERSSHHRDDFDWLVLRLAESDVNT